MTDEACVLLQHALLVLSCCFDYNSTGWTKGSLLLSRLAPSMVESSCLDAVGWKSSLCVRASKQLGNYCSSQIVEHCSDCHRWMDWKQQFTVHKRRNHCTCQSINHYSYKLGTSTIKSWCRPLTCTWSSQCLDICHPAVHNLHGNLYSCSDEGL